MSERKPKEYLSDEDIMDYHRETVATESEQSELRFTLQAIALWIGKYDAANATIATLTAERDALVAAVRQTESVTKDKTDKQQASEWMMVDAKEWRAVLALAQQDQPAGEVLDADTLTIYFRGDITKPHSLTSEDYDKLKASGMLWELYPDAPDHFIAATAR